jgi:hypothetical protein
VLSLGAGRLTGADADGIDARDIRPPSPSQTPARASPVAMAGTPSFADHETRIDQAALRRRAATSRPPRAPSA